MAVSGSCSSLASSPYASRRYSLLETKAPSWRFVARSMAVTAARIGGQLVATSSNMFVYWDPCPVNRLATAPSVAMPWAR